MNEEITISKAYYDDLIADQRFLCALIACGVDNWDGYDMAQDMVEDQE